MIQTKKNDDLHLYFSFLKVNISMIQTYNDRNIDMEVKQYQY